MQCFSKYFALSVFDMYPSYGLTYHSTNTKWIDKLKLDVGVVIQNKVPGDNYTYKRCEYFDNMDIGVDWLYSELLSLLRTNCGEKVEVGTLFFQSHYVTFASHFSNYDAAFSFRKFEHADKWTSYIVITNLPVEV